VGPALLTCNRPAVDRGYSSAVAIRHRTTPIKYTDVVLTVEVSISTAGIDDVYRDNILQRDATATVGRTPAMTKNMVALAKTVATNSALHIIYSWFSP
jgi:hypothetical protein